MHSLGLQEQLRTICEKVAPHYGQAYRNVRFGALAAVGAAVGIGGDGDGLRQPQYVSFVQQSESRKY